MPLSLTPEQWQQLRDVNTEVNAIPYNALPGPGEPDDYYTDTPEPNRSFVCRSYTQRKGTLLREAGWPGEYFREFTCYTEPVGDPPQRERHAVLAIGPIETPDNPIILDSRFPEPYYRLQCPADYQWEGRQRLSSNEEFEPIPVS